MFIVEHQPHGSLAHFRGKLVRCLAHNGSTFSAVGASGKPGAVHDEAQGVAAFLLPEEIVAIVSALVKDLSRNDGANHETFIDKIGGEWRLAKTAREERVRIGKRDLA